MLTKDNKDLPIEKITAENFLVPKGEEKRYHVKMEIPRYDPSTGKKMSKPRIMAIGINTFKTVGANIKKQGYTMEILHDPLAVKETGTAEETPSSTGKKPKRAKGEVAPTVEGPEDTPGVDEEETN